MRSSVEQAEPELRDRPYAFFQLCNLGASTPPENLRTAVEAAHAAPNP